MKKKGLIVLALSFEVAILIVFAVDLPSRFNFSPHQRWVFMVLGIVLALLLFFYQLVKTFWS